MTTFKKTIIAASLLLGLHGAQLKAEDVQLFDQPPSAEEMGKALFGESDQSADKPGIKMRSIHITKKAQHSQDLVASAQQDLKSIGLPIKFASGSDRIMGESMAFVNQVGKMLTLDAYASKKMLIGGHTDSAGSDDVNMALSQKRAEAVKSYLVQNFGISSDRLLAKGFGETQPLPGRKSSDEANRRVQFYNVN